MPLFRENGTARYTLPRLFALLLFLFLSFEFSAQVSYLPSILSLRNSNPLSTSLMRFRGSPPKREEDFVPLARISDSLKEGVIICEDNGFYRHKGFDPGSIKFAFVQNLKHRAIVYGGSTITQQLARTMYLTPRKTLYRKYRELFLAVTMEVFLSKDRILELYFNYAEWGPDVYGIGGASRYHFHKDAADLTLEEEAALISILPNPLKWDTDSFRQNELLVRRWFKICSYYGIEILPEF